MSEQVKQMMKSHHSISTFFRYLHIIVIFGMVVFLVGCAQSQTAEDRKAKEDILAEPFPVKNGKVVVPTGPGLGVEPDMNKVEKYTTQFF